MTAASTERRAAISVGTLSASLGDLRTVEDWARTAQALASLPSFAADITAALDDFDLEQAARTDQARADVVCRCARAHRDAWTRHPPETPGPSVPASYTRTAGPGAVITAVAP
jgi:hypothetical protein